MDIYFGMLYRIILFFKYRLFCFVHIFLTVLSVYRYVVQFRREFILIGTGKFYRKFDIPGRIFFSERYMFCCLTRRGPYLLQKLDRWAPRVEGWGSERGWESWEGWTFSIHQSEIERARIATTETGALLWWIFIHGISREGRRDSGRGKTRDTSRSCKITASVQMKEISETAYVSETPHVIRWKKIRRREDGGGGGELRGRKGVSKGLKCDCEKQCELFAENVKPAGCAANVWWKREYRNSYFYY